MFKQITHPHIYNHTLPPTPPMKVITDEAWNEWLEDRNAERRSAHRSLQKMAVRISFWEPNINNKQEQQRTIHPTIRQSHSDSDSDPTSTTPIEAGCLKNVKSTSENLNRVLNSVRSLLSPFTI